MFQGFVFFHPSLWAWCILATSTWVRLWLYRGRGRSGI